jgi:hypothetical protein
MVFLTIPSAPDERDYLQGDITGFWGFWLSAGLGSHCVSFEIECHLLLPGQNADVPAGKPHIKQSEGAQNALS